MLNQRFKKIGVYSILEEQKTHEWVAQRTITYSIKSASLNVGGCICERPENALHEKNNIIRLYNSRNYDHVIVCRRIRRRSDGSNETGAISSDPVIMGSPSRRSMISRGQWEAN